MLTPDLIAELIQTKLKESFRANTQSDIAGQLKLSQSIVSRLMNQSYSISAPENSVFTAVAVYYGQTAEDFWTNLEQEATAQTDLDYAGRGKLSIGMASYAVYTAPFIHALMRFEFPNWLRLGYVHQVAEDEAGNRYPNLTAPDYWDATNFNQNIKPNTTQATNARNPFLNCYTSEDLIDLIDSPANDSGKRRFQAIFCPEISADYCMSATNDVLTLKSGIELVKVATVCTGYGSLLIVASIEEKTPDFRGFTEDEKLKGYRIDNEALTMNTLNPEKKRQNKDEFLSRLSLTDKTPNFFLRGIDSTHSFDKFRELWEVKRPEKTEDDYEPKKERYDKWQYLMATRGVINYTRDSADSFETIAAMMKERKKLVLVAHPPFVHNAWQRIKEALADLPDTRYVQQYRYNFSQWLGPQQYNLYITKNHLTIQNISRLNELLLQIEQSRSSIAHNDDLPDFFYYDPVTERDNSATKISLETKFLFSLACQELGFDAQPPIVYSATFLRLLLDAK